VAWVLEDSGIVVVGAQIIIVSVFAVFVVIVIVVIGGFVIVIVIGCIIGVFCWRSVLLCWVSMLVVGLGD